MSMSGFKEPKQETNSRSLDLSSAPGRTNESSCLMGMQGSLKLNGYVIAVLAAAGSKDRFRHGLSEPGETRIQRHPRTAFQRESTSLQTQPGRRQRG